MTTTARQPRKGYKHLGNGQLARKGQGQRGMEMCPACSNEPQRLRRLLNLPGAPRRIPIILLMLLQILRPEKKKKERGKQEMTGNKQKEHKTDTIHLFQLFSSVHLVLYLGSGQQHVKFP